jgi:hypothetical protein
MYKKQPFLGRKHIRKCKKGMEPFKGSAEECHFRSSLLSCHYDYETWPYHHPKHFDPDDGSGTFLPNIGVPYQTTWYHNPGVNNQNLICCHEKVHNMSCIKYVYSVILLMYITV